LIDEAIVKYICKCESCQKIFSKLKRHIEAIETLNDQDKKL